MTDEQIIAAFEAEIENDPSAYERPDECVYQITANELVRATRAILATTAPTVEKEASGDEMADGELIADLIEQNRTLRARLASPTVGGSAGEPTIQITPFNAEDYLGDPEVRAAYEAEMADVSPAQTADALQHAISVIRVIADQDPVEMALDPTWAKRIAQSAIRALANGDAK